MWLTTALAAAAAGLGLLAFVVARRAVLAQRHAKNEAENANRRLTDFVELSSDWLWEQGPDLRFTYMSDSVWEHAALSPEESFGKTRRETAPLGLSEEEWAAHEALLQRREPFKDLRYYRIGPNGDRRYLSISGMPVFGPDGSFRGYRGFGRDVTTMIRAEQRANEINSRLLQAIDARSEGLAFWDADDRLVMCNQAYREQSGDARSALVPGIPYVDYMRASIAAGEIPAAVGREEEWLRNRLEQREGVPYTVEIFRGGRWLLIREQETPDGGKLLTVTDISELKRREDALVDAVAEAQLANRAKMAFLATMSHELRTPLNAIIGFAEIIQTGQLAAKAVVQSEYAGYIHESGTHLLSVINDLLDVSRIEAGRLALDEKPFPLASLLEECDRMIRQRAQGEGLRLAIAAFDPAIGVHGDRRAIKQVLLNLLSNAIKFTAPGGAVTLTAERGSVGGLRIVVSDTGIGVEADRVPELFQPFRQLENVHARRHHGTGLGLYISKSLIEAHGGSIRFESCVGQGSTVTVTLAEDRLIDADSPPRRRAVG